MCKDSHILMCKSIKPRSRRTRLHAGRLKVKDEAIQQAKKEADEGSLAADKLFKEIEAASGTIARTKPALATFRRKNEA